MLVQLNLITQMMIQLSMTLLYSSAGKSAFKEAVPASYLMNECFPDTLVTLLQYFLSPEHLTTAQENQPGTSLLGSAYTRIHMPVPTVGIHPEPHVQQ